MDHGTTRRFCAGFCGVLENLARKKSLTPLSPPRCRSCTAFGGAPDSRALEFAGRAPRAFLSAVEGIAKHPRHRICSAQEMHLKAVRLFFRARLGVNAADIRFRIGIGSSSHGRLPNNYVKQRENQRVAMFLSLAEAFSGGGKFQSRHFFSYSSSGKRT